MPTVVEAYNSRDFTGGENPSIVFRYHVLNVDDADDAEAAALAAAPASYINALGKVLRRNTWSSRIITPNDYHVDITFGAKKNTEEGDFSYSFDTGGGRAKIEQSLQTVNRYARSGEVATDHKGSIGVDSDGNVAGVDIQTSGFSWTEMHTFAPATVNHAYRVALADLTYTVNNATFRGFPAGDVLFAGARGAIAKDDLWKISFAFIREKAVSGLTIGEIEGIAKAGHDYLWFEKAEFLDEASDRLATVPIAAHVERVYKQENFAGIGIGTSEI